MSRNVKFAPSGKENTMSQFNFLVTNSACKFINSFRKSLKDNLSQYEKKLTYFVSCRSSPCTVIIFIWFITQNYFIFMKMGWSPDNDLFDLVFVIDIMRTARLTIAVTFLLFFSKPYVSGQWTFYVLCDSVDFLEVLITPSKCRQWISRKDRSKSLLCFLWVCRFFTLSSYNFKIMPQHLEVRIKGL